MFVAFGAQHVVQRRFGVAPGAVVVEGRAGLEEGDQVHFPTCHAGRRQQWPIRLAIVMVGEGRPSTPLLLKQGKSWILGLRRG
jgi:hypothetical protein